MRIRIVRLPVCEIVFVHVKMMVEPEMSITLLDQ